MNRKRETSIWVVFALLAVVMVLSIIIAHDRENEIYQWANTNGYKVISIEDPWYDQGPFKWYEGGKGITFSTVHYLDENQTYRTVWFRFGGIHGTQIKSSEEQ